MKVAAVKGAAQCYGIPVVHKIVKPKVTKSKLVVVYRCILLKNIGKRGIALKVVALCSIVANGFALVKVGAGKEVHFSLPYIDIPSGIYLAPLINSGPHISIVTNA